MESLVGELVDVEKISGASWNTERYGELLSLSGDPLKVCLRVEKAKKDPIPVPAPTPVSERW